MKTGQELYQLYTAKHDEYAQDLRTIFLNIGDKIFPLLEQTEKDHKRLKIDMPDNILWDEISVNFFCSLGL